MITDSWHAKKKHQMAAGPDALRNPMLQRVGGQLWRTASGTKRLLDQVEATQNPKSTAKKPNEIADATRRIAMSKLKLPHTR